jgi:hypothetical protein
MREERVMFRPCEFILFDLIFPPKVLDKFFPLRHASLSLKLDGKADCQFHGSSRKPSVQ